MTRETKFGLLLVLVLTSVFGFLVWKKMHQPKDLVATTETVESAEVGGATPPDPVEPLVEPAATATPLVAIPTERVTPRRPTTPGETTPRGEDLFAAPTPVATTSRSKPKLPVDLDKDFFNAPEQSSSRKPVKEIRTASTEADPFGSTGEMPRSARGTSAAREQNPFDSVPESVPVLNPAATATMEQSDLFGDQTEPVANNTQSAPDEFAESMPVLSRSAESVEVEVTATPVNDPDPFGNPTIEIPAEQSIEVPARREVEIAMPAEVMTVEEPPARPLAVPAAVNPRVDRQIALATQIEEKDPFDSAGAETPVEISARSAPKVPASVAAEVVEPVLEIPTRTEPVTIPSRSAAAAKQPDPFFEEVNVPEPVRAAPTSRSQPPIRRAAPPVADPDPFGAPAAVPQLPVREEPFPVRTEPVPHRTMPQPRTTPHVAFSGETYIVQPNDNFWTISKKVYGSGRYFEALAQYNASVVPDVAKMKPGLKIATPAAAELQARFPKLLATAGTQDVAHDPASLGIPGDVYVTQSGDNFWEISKRLYGDGKYFRALEQHNAAIVSNPQKLKPGMKLAAPKAHWLQAKYPQLVAHAAPAVQDLKRTQPDRYQPDEPAGFFVGPGEQPMYRVGTKDTLSDIAQAYLGRSSRWVQIYHLNRDVLTDGNALNVGTVLKLPADASRVVLIEHESPRR